jgi:hypothetical protein
MNKKHWLGSVLLLVFFASALCADSQFRIDVLPQDSKFIFQGKPSDTVGITAFMQEGLDYLKNEKVVYSVSQNVTWQNFLRNNGVRLRPGSDRFALRSDRYYRFFHVSISAVKPHQSGFVIPWSRLRDLTVVGGLIILGISSLIYLFWPTKSSAKPKPKAKSKVKAKAKIKKRSKAVSLSKKTTRKTLKKKKVKKTVKKAVRKISKKKDKKKDKKKEKKKSLKKRSKISRVSKTIEASVSQPLTLKKSKSVLIKPTAQRIKNIKLARQLALKTTPKKDLTLNDFIQEDIANSPSVMLNPPTKTELRTNSSDDL